MKASDKPTNGQKVWVCALDKWAEAVYEYEATTSGHHRVFIKGNLAIVHRLQIRLTPPKKKAREFKAGDKVMFMGMLKDRDGGEYRELPFTVMVDDYCIAYATKDGRLSESGPVVLQKIRSKANA